MTKRNAGSARKNKSLRNIQEKAFRSLFLEWVTGERWECGKSLHGEGDENGKRGHDLRKDARGLK